MQNNIYKIILIVLITLGGFLAGNLLFSIVISIITFFALLELISIRKSTKNFPIEIEVFSYIIVILMIYNNYGKDLNYNFLDYRYISALILVNIVPIIFINNTKKYGLSDALFLIGSTLFIGTTFNLIIMLNNYNSDYLIYLFLISLFTDLFSYIAGKLIGKYKLYKDMDSDKTIEGLIFGTVMGTFIPTLFFLAKININIPIIIVIFITFILSVLAQIGDLVFNNIKKEYVKKDKKDSILNFKVLNEIDSLIFIVLGFILILSVL